MASITDSPFRSQIGEGESMIRHAGVPVRVLQVEDGYEADFRALAGFINDPGGTVVAKTEELAIRLACDKIDEAIFAVANQLDR